MWGWSPKGALLFALGKTSKRFVIPMEYLGHQAFALLLRAAEEEFGCQREDVLKIPCQVSVFENILRMMELDNKRVFTKSASNAFMCRFHDYSGKDRHGDGEKTDATIHNGATNNVNTSATLGYCYSHHCPPDCGQAYRHRQQEHHPQMCR